MVGWHHQFNGHELGQTPGDSEGQGSLVYCSPWDCKSRTQLGDSAQLSAKLTLKTFSTYIFGTTP